MLENSIIALIVGICAFFIIRKMYKQLKGTGSGCGCSCTECDHPKSAPNSNTDGKNQHNFPINKHGCNCSTTKGED